MIEPARTSRAAVETLIATIVFTLIWALLLNAALELFHSGGDLLRLVGFNLYRHFPMFALSAGVIWVVLLLIVAVTGRLWVSCAGSLALVLLVGMVDRVKIRIRMEPVYPSDVQFLRSPGFLFSMVSPWQLLLGAGLLVLVVVAVTRLGRIPSRTFRPIWRAELPRWWWSLLGVRVLTTLICLNGLLYAGSFNEEDNKLRNAFEGQGAEWAFWYQNLNYTQNGVVAGMLYNLLADPMDEPPGYSADTMEEIAHRWTSVARRMNAARSGTLDDVNVIVVLSEAFSDPLNMEGVTLEDDPIPFTRKLMRETTSGEMLAQLYGGGTANMEFEVLTGQSLAEFNPQVNTPYQQFVHRQDDYPTIAGYLQAKGHRAIAIHPYITAMYQREDVYRAFGIDEFIHDTTMHSTEKIDDSEFISDAAAFNEVLLQVEENEQPLLVNLVTMQNHYPMSDIYDDPWPVAGLSGDDEDQVSGYARGLNYTDRALQHFIQQLRSSEEKTAVIFYGDHLPGIWSKEVQEVNGERAMKSTPFFVWTNFKTPKLPTAELTSPIYFVPLLFNQLGAELPPYYALLSRMYAEIPAMEHGVRLDRDGEPLPEGGEYEQLLLDYRLLQYDLSIGERYVKDDMFYPSEDAELVETKGER